MQISDFIIDKQYKGLNPLQFGYENCEPLHFYGPAVRTHWLLHYVVSGEGVFIREGNEYHLKSGDIFVIPPHIETYYRAESENPWTYIWIGFSCDGELPVELGDIIHFKKAGNIFEDMKHCLTMEQGKSAFLSGKLWQLMGLILENPEAQTVGNESDYIKKALSYMNTEYARDINVTEIAKNLNLNRSYFTTLFTKQVGISPHKYLSNLRLDTAAKLMTGNGSTPTVAAISTGYTDIYQFSKMFKKKFGVSPTAYIKNRK